MNEYETVVRQIWSEGEEVTLEEIGQRLEDLILAMNLPQARAEACIRFWLKISDHQDPSRLPIVTDFERESFLYLAKRIEEGIRQ